jgi:hypothetical protein
MATITPVTNFWSSATVEPKRQYRWEFSIGAAGFFRWMIKSVDKPVATIGTTEHKYFGHVYKYPGNTTWNDINITLIDPASPDAVNALANILYQSGYKPPTTNAFLPTMMSKKSITNKIGEIKIRQIGPASDGISPITLEEWTLHNPIIKSADFGGNLSYENEGLIEVKMTVAYDWAKLKTANVGAIGTVNGVDAALELWK